MSRDSNLVAALEVCPCGGASYARCCAPWHLGQAAPTAEALMRSRYSAFVKQEAAYLLRTWHSTQRPPSIEFEVGLKWLGLKVVSHHSVGDAATVEFIARYRVGGQSAARLHERSRFVREAGQWWYVDGVQP